jgi:glycosyltransferase involved in cell wall biosynthesis
MMVSVAICTWNRCESLRLTLEQLTRLRIPAGTTWELLVVNNNCTDATDSVCHEFDGRLPIRVLHETRPGQSFARNLAIQEAQGTYILWTDDDVIVDPAWLELIVATFERESADWVFGTSEPEWPGKPPAWYDARFRGYFAALDYGPQSFMVTNSSTPFFGLNCAGSRRAHLALGGFRTEFGLKGTGGGVGEDMDMFNRALQAKMKIVYIPDARVRHMIPPARVRKHYHRRRQWVANRIVYQHLDELFPNPRWTLGMPRFFYGNGARAAVGYLRCLATRNTSERFQHELEFLRIVKLTLEAARSGFRKKPARQNAAAPPVPQGGVASR